MAYEFTINMTPSNSFEEELLSFMKKNKFVKFTCNKGDHTYRHICGVSTNKEELDPNSDTYKSMEELEDLYDSADFGSEPIQVEITERQLESYKRAEECCRELRHQLSMACNWDSETLFYYLLRWMNKTDSEVKYTRPTRKERLKDV